MTVDPARTAFLSTCKRAGVLCGHKLKDHLRATISREQLRKDPELDVFTNPDLGGIQVKSSAAVFWF